MLLVPKEGVPAESEYKIYVDPKCPRTDSTVEVVSPRYGRTFKFQYVPADDEDREYQAAGYPLPQDVEVLPGLPFRHAGVDVRYDYVDPQEYPWVVDSKGRCWVDNSLLSGDDAMVQVSPRKMLDYISDPRERMQLRKLLGVLPAMPEWERAAYLAGWTPPEGWDIAQYDPETVPRRK